MIFWTVVLGCERPEDAENQVAPCEGPDWGLIEEEDADLEEMISVRSDGYDAVNDPEAGKLQAPFRTLQAALEASRVDGAPKTIAIGPGEFEAALDLLEETDDDLRIVGCNPLETKLVPASAGEPQLKVTAATGVALTGVTLEGGDRGLWVWGGAGVEVRDVIIADGGKSGFVVDGPFTVMDLENVTVVGTRSVGGVGGYGGEIDGSTVTWSGGGAWDNTAVGLVVSGETADLTLTDVEISDTLPNDDGAFGRGVQIQSYASASLVDCLLVNNRDAGVFSLLGEQVDLERVTVEQTAGDGIVVTGVDAAGRQLDPATFTVHLDGNAVTDPDRAGIILERVTGVATGNQVTGADQRLVAQEGAVVTGPDEIEVLEVPLELNRDEVGAVLAGP